MGNPLTGECKLSRLAEGAGCRLLLDEDALPLSDGCRFLRGLRPAEAGQHGKEGRAPHDGCIGRDIREL
jgi:hypothetical protein